MTRVLVTGGTGVLGRAIVRHLEAQGVTVRVLSRRDQPRRGQTEWVRGDLTTGAGLAAAFAGVDVVVHSATSQKASEDLTLTRQVLKQANNADGHITSRPWVKGLIQTAMMTSESHMIWLSPQSVLMT